MMVGRANNVYWAHIGLRRIEISNEKLLSFEKIFTEPAFQQVCYKYNIKTRIPRIKLAKDTFVL